MSPLKKQKLSKIRSELDKLDNSLRGDKGFGSTGK